MAADVLTTLAGWLPTSGSNAPGGTTSVSSNLDDNLREMQGVTVRGLSHKGADIASATTTDLGAVEGLFHDITGTTTITGLGTVRAGLVKKIKFEGILILTHSASLILKYAQNHLTADGDVFEFISEGAGVWREMSRNVAGGDVAPGVIMEDGGASAPAGWLQCFGQAVSRTTYSAIFARYSTTYGVGDGSTTFNLPDIRGRVVAGQDDMGGSSANRLTGSPTGSVDGDVLGATGGEESHTLTAAESGLPLHNHTYIAGGVAGAGNGFTGAGVHNDNQPTSDTGGTSASSAHNNVQPVIIMNKIIKT